MLTALFAVIALVFGTLAFAGVANAKDNPNKPDNPGNSQNAPGHEITPPGQQDDGTPGNSDGTPGGGNDNNGGSNGNGPEKVWVCHADTNNGNGQPNLGQGGTGGENKTGFNIIYISVNAWENGHMGRHPNDKAFDTEAGALGYCGTPTEQHFFCPTDSTVTTELGHQYTEADRATCYPTTQTFACPTGTDRVGTAMDHQYAATNPADVAFCDITDQQAAAIDAALAATVPEAVTVAPVEPATVAPVEAATVPVPATAKPLPATVPAGDGSSAPTVPVYALALLALAATALAGSAVRLATRRNG